MVERLLAKEKVASSNLVFRSRVIQGGVAKWLRRGSAKPLFSGSSPLAASSALPRWRNGRRGGLKIRSPQGGVGSSPSLGTKVVSLVTHPQQKARPSYNPDTLGGLLSLACVVDDLDVQCDMRLWGAQTLDIAL